ncbi:alpha/beta fold hydrolase [Streptomyces sp. NPDC046716]|uniref:alpha/beta fold hydrolase n=1 Tax=Streptomyces sp. NPDC046716 TaxID=3157093 RepID=UPI0033CA1CA6
MTTYRTEGNGPALVLVHGAGPGAVTWNALVDRFTDRHTVILPDLSGSDPAPDPGTDLTLEGLTGELAAVIEDRGAGPADIVGHSLGAVVALSLAATRPDLVRRLIPVAGFAHAAQDAYVRTVMRIWRDLVDDKETFSRFAMLVAFSGPYLNRLAPDAVEELAGAFPPAAGRVRQLDLVLRADLRPLLPLIQAPTLVIGCAADALVPVRHAREIHAGIPGSSYAELDSGHVMRAERPEEFVSLVRGFLG